MRILDRLKMRWSGFVYNFGWSDYVSVIDGWIPRFSMFFPIAGYLIIVNDQVSDWLTFARLTDGVAAEGLASGARLRCIYFGLLLLGLSNLLYRARRPYCFRIGASIMEFTRAGLEFFNFGDYIQMHGRIRSEGHISVDGKYYDSEWDGFSQAARNSDEGTDEVKRDGHWEESKRQYGDLLRSILREEFLRQDRGRRATLATCLALSGIGYLLLAVPSVDLFIRVTQSTVRALLT